MIRPMTSDVSALSGIVANGHQAIQIVSSAPVVFGRLSAQRIFSGAGPKDGFGLCFCGYRHRSVSRA